MALIELATNNDVNAIVEAILSLKQEPSVLSGIGSSFGASLAGALGGATLAYLFQRKSTIRQNQVQRIIELNALAQEIDRLANQLKNVKKQYVKNLSTDSLERLAASRRQNFKLLPPRYRPDGRTLLSEEICPGRTLTMLNIDHLFTSFEDCFIRWDELSSWHYLVCRENSIGWTKKDDHHYINALKSLGSLYIAPKMMLADHLFVLTDYLIIESYYYILAIRKSCIRLYNQKAIKEAGGLFFTQMRSFKEHEELLSPVKIPSNPLYATYHQPEETITYRERTLTPPTAEAIENDQKTGMLR